MVSVINALGDKCCKKFKQPNEKIFITIGHNFGLSEKFFALNTQDYIKNMFSINVFQ